LEGLFRPPQLLVAGVVLILAQLELRVLTAVLVGVVHTLVLEEHQPQALVLLVKVLQAA
jgi:hypothetical protein